MPFLNKYFNRNYIHDRVILNCMPDRVRARAQLFIGVLKRWQVVVHIPMYISTGTYLTWDGITSYFLVNIKTQAVTLNDP